MRKLELLRRLERRRLARAADLLRLHECLCFWRAYPDDAGLLAQVERMLEGFAGRSDLRRHRETLADSGVAGTPIHYSFFWPTALWLARHWPGATLASTGPSLRGAGAACRVPAPPGSVLREPGPGHAGPLARGVDRASLKGPRRERRRLSGSAASTRCGSDRSAGKRCSRASTCRSAWRREPARRRAPWTGSPDGQVVFQTGPLSRGAPRPAPGGAAAAAAGSAHVSPREGERLIDLAREAMVTRGRDLEVFAQADPERRRHRGLRRRPAVRLLRRACRSAA